MLCIGVNFEIDPNHLTPRVRPIFQMNSCLDDIRDTTGSELEVRSALFSER